MEKGQFQLTKLEVSEFYLGWNQLARSPLSPLHPKYEKLKNDLALFNSQSEKLIKKQASPSDALMQQLVESKEQVSALDRASNSLKFRNAIRQTKCSRLLNTMSQIRQTLDSLQQDNQSIESLTAFVKRKMPPERSPSPPKISLSVGTLKSTAKFKLPDIKHSTQKKGRVGGQNKQGRNSSLEGVKSDKTRLHRAMQLTQESKKNRKMLSSQRSQRRSPNYHGSRRPSQARKKQQQEVKNGKKTLEEEVVAEMSRTNYKLPYLRNVRLNGKQAGENGAMRGSLAKQSKLMKLKIKSHMLQPVSK